MPCPTCSHALECVVALPGDAALTYHWCPRCGTLVDSANGTRLSHQQPKLVDRCRLFQQTFPPGNPPSVSYSREWHRIGIAEAINLPGERT